MIIDGKNIAKNIYEETKNQVKNLSKKPKLVAVLVGKNDSSIRYINQKKKWAEYVGIDFELKEFSQDVQEKELLKIVQELNNDQNVNGYIVQLPLPKNINTNKIINAINPKKDVDGFTPVNQGKILIGDSKAFEPCTPAGIIEVLKSEKIKLEGKVVCVVGRSNIVGKPITAMLINAGATVISCNSKTKDIAKFTTQADIIIVAAGKPEILKVNMLKMGTTVIDVGFSVIDGKIYGDADAKLIDKTGNNVTPVPGGVGALTVAMLMKNTLKAYKLQNK